MKALELFRAAEMECPISFADWPGARVSLQSRVSPDKDGPNEDCALVAVLDDGTIVAAVADGAGGHGSGDVASRLAVEALASALDAPDEVPVRARILNGVEAAHRRIIEDTRGAATTIAVVEIAAGAARTYHAGDSGALVTGGLGRIKLQTVFHSPTGYGVESGLLDEEEALSHDERHVVSNLLGLEPMSVEMGSPIALAPRDTVVLASDGLFDNLYVDEIATLVRRGPIEVACERVVAEVSRRMVAESTDDPGKPDDLTVVVLRTATRG